MNWLLPNARNLRAWPCIVVGLAENIALIFFLARKAGRFTNLQNIYYERINLAWHWMASLGPLIPIVALSPVLIYSKNRIHRWSALVLIVLPDIVAFNEWGSLLSKAISHGLWR